MVPINPYHCQHEFSCTFSDEVNIPKESQEFRDSIIFDEATFDQGVKYKEEGKEAEAMKCFEAVANSRDTSTLIQQGKACSSFGLQEKAVRFFQLADMLNDLNGTVALGLCCLKGKGLKKNEDAAVELFRKALQKRNPEACFALGICYNEGRGVKQDRKTAKEIFERAVTFSKSDGLSESERLVKAEALSELGRYYFTEQHGTGKAFEYYKQSALLGSSSGYSGLGYCYSTGCGVEENEILRKEAIAQAIAAAKNGQFLDLG